MLKPLQNQESCNRLLKQINSQSVVECRFPQSSEISEVIAVYPQVSVVSCEPSSGRVNYSGKLILTIVYCDEEGKLCRMQKGAEFSHFADDDCLAPAQNCVCALSCAKTNVKREGSSFVIAAIISADISVYARADRTYISDAEGAFVKKESVTLSSTVNFSGETEVEDDFEADSVVDVLIPCAKAVVQSCVCGTGEVEASGEIYLSLFAMRQSTPVCFERVIPFKCSVPCDDASVGCRAAARAEISDLNVTANVNEDARMRTAVCQRAELRGCRRRVFRHSRPVACEYGGVRGEVCGHKGIFRTRVGACRDEEQAYIRLQISCSGASAGGVLLQRRNGLRGGRGEHRACIRAERRD